MSNKEDINACIGRRIRARRTTLGLSQAATGKAMGVTFQQIQKYEKGANSISADKLFGLSKVMKIPTSFFFEELEDNATFKTQTLPLNDFSVSDRETLEIMKAFKCIKSPLLRKRLADLARMLASTSY